jgi:predicted DNA-binding transcriptional regulator AlpA
MSEESAPRKLLDERDVAELLGVAVSTVSKMRYQGIGLAFVKVGKITRYQWSDVQEWLDQQRRCEEE